jgi:hypothetical protein
MPLASRCTTLFLLCAAMVVLPSARTSAQQLTEDVPILGGTTATAQALGIEMVPDRPRFLAELIRVIYDAREGRNPEIDAKLARLATHRSVIERFQATLAALQSDTIVISLAMSPVKGERGRLRDFLDLVGLKLREKDRRLTVEPSNDKRAAARIKLVASLGIDLRTLAAQLNGGETVRIEVATDTVPVPLTAKLWSDAIFQRPVTAGELFPEIMADRRAALLAHGLAAVDDDTLGYLAGHPDILTQLYEHGAPSFAAFGDALRIRGGRVIPYGGLDGARAWEEVLGAPPTQPDRFIRELFSAGHGRVALLYQTLAHLDTAHVRFALGSWMPDAAARVEQFKQVVAAELARDEWDVDIRPFIRPVHDPSMLLALVRVLPNGAPPRPASRLFWQRVFESADLSDDPARQLRNLQDEGLIDAGWLAQNVALGDPRTRSARSDQLAFGQRAFAASSDADLPDALLALRSIGRFRMLMLALDRIGVRNAKTYAAAARQAERISALTGQRGFTAVAQYQSAIAIVGRLVRVRSLSPDAGAALVANLVTIPLNDEGAYGGALVRWTERALIPALSGPAADDLDARLIRALAGAASADAAIPKVEWEGRTYSVDLIAPEQRRITRALEKMGAPPIRLALDLEHLAARVAAPSVAVPQVREALVELRTIGSAVVLQDKKNTIVPPGIDRMKSPGDIIEHVLGELTKISRPQDLPRAPQAVGPLFSLSDEILADALLSLAYALDIGNPDGTTLLGGNVSRRHDFGFAYRDQSRRVGTTWAMPMRVLNPGVPWHVAGSVLGLDGALSTLALRRIDTGELPAAPVLMMPDRDTFTKTLAWINPFELADADRDAIVAAIARGRSRVETIARDGTGWDETADEIRMDGWRRRAGRWAISHEASRVPSFFSLVELMYLGAPPQNLPLDEWGMASDAIEACVCTKAPLPGHAAIVVGRPQLGLLAAEVADINLHVAEVLSARKLPATLIPGVLAGAIQDYIDQVRPLHADDWLTLVRAAQAISDDRLDDYVAALTTDGPLAPERASGPPDGKRP